MTKKFVSMFLALAMCLTLSAPAFAVEGNPSYDEDYINTKFEELFPEYQEYIQNHDDAVAQAQAESSAVMNLTLDDSPEVTETVTRVDGDDVYALSLLSDGGYAKIALVSGKAVTSGASWNGGTQNGTTWTNRKVAAYISSGGLFPYTGGIAGEHISYTLNGSTSGSFSSWGDYIGTNVYPGYEDATFVRKDSNLVKVEGYATYYAVIGSHEEVLIKYTMLTIDLTQRDGENPKLTFDFQ